MLALATVLLGGCAKAPPAPAAAPAVLRLSQRNEPADLDPATATLPDDFFVLRALSEGLVAPAPAGGGITPAAASHWEISPDSLSYTFHLRPDARWSNGDRVTAADFVASYRRLLSPATAAPKAALFYAVKNARAFASGSLADFAAVGIHAADARTLVLTLERPTPQFLHYVASGPWLPVHPPTVAAHGRAWTRPGHFVGNGPFLLTEWRPHQRLVVSRNPHYHTPASVRLDAIHFLAFDNEISEDLSYRSGQVDITMAVPRTKLDTYARERPAELHRAALAETRYLAFNTTRPPLDDPRVRRALALALDRRQLADRVLRGGQDPAYRFVPPALRSAQDQHIRLDGVLLEDLALARRLLSEAGFPDGQNFPPLELSSWVNSPIVEAVQAMWREALGVRISLVNREAKVHLAALHAGTYDIAFITEIPDVPDAASFLADFTTGAAGNYPHWSDPEFDRLLAAAARSPDLSAQSTHLRAAEARLLAACPLAPLYFNTRNWLMSPRVQGWRHDALWTRFYLHVSLSPP